MSSHRLLFGFFLQRCCCVSLPPAASVTALAEEAAQFQLSSDPNQMVLRFSERVGEVQSDDHPWVVVYML
jgi:hypothetical protein